MGRFVFFGLCRLCQLASSSAVESRKQARTADSGASWSTNRVLLLLVGLCYAQCSSVGPRTCAHSSASSPELLTSRGAFLGANEREDTDIELGPSTKPRRGDTPARGQERCVGRTTQYIEAEGGSSVARRRVGVEHYVGVCNVSHGHMRLAPSPTAPRSRCTQHLSHS